MSRRPNKNKEDSVPLVNAGIDRGNYSPMDSSDRSNVFRAVIFLVLASLLIICVVLNGVILKKVDDFEDCRDHEHRGPLLDPDRPTCAPMSPPSGTCADCACPPDDRTTCPSLQVPLKTLPKGCDVPPNYFYGKKVLVTGATSGFGLETAKLFKQYGAHVVGTSRTPLLKANLVDYELMQLEYASFDSIDALVVNYINKFGCPPDILISNGATAVIGLNSDLTDELITYEMAVVFSGHASLITKFVHALPTKESGFTVLATASQAAYGSSPMVMLYSAAKHALRMFIEFWGFENNDEYPNVFMGFVAPSGFQTNFGNNAIYFTNVNRPKASSIQVLKDILFTTGGIPTTVARAYLEFAYMRGQNQTCDIGYAVYDDRTPETYANAAFGSNILYDIYANKLPIDTIQGLTGLFPIIFNTTLFSYPTSYTDCNPPV